MDSLTSFVGWFIFICFIFLIYFALKKKKWNSFLIGFGFAFLTEIVILLHIWIAHPLLRDVFMNIVMNNLTVILPIFTIAVWIFVAGIRWVKGKVDLRKQTKEKGG